MSKFNFSRNPYFGYPMHEPYFNKMMCSNIVVFRTCFNELESRSWYELDFSFLSRQRLKIQMFFL